MAQKDNPPQRVKRNLAAEMLGSGEFENEQTAMVGGGYSMCNCFIRRDGVPLDETNNTVLPGHQINLDFTCYGGRSGVTNVQWTIPGKPFTNYEIINNATTKSAKLTKLQPADLTNIAITFYWPDSGDKDIKVKFTDRYGNDCEFTSTITVLDLNPTFKGTVVGEVQALSIYNQHQLSNAVSFCQLIATHDIDNGIVWKGTVNLPSGSGFNPGYWNIVQLIKVNTASNEYSDGTCTSYDMPGYILDTYYPAFPYPSPPSAYTTGNDAQSDAGDFPAAVSPATGPHAGSFNQATADFEFMTYAMFRPSEANSQWVPVSYIPWYCKWCAILTTYGVWILQSQASPPSGDIAATATSDHPEWTDWGPQRTGTTCAPTCT